MNKSISFLIIIGYEVNLRSNILNTNRSSESINN